MKFLKFVIDYENQPDIWQAHASTPLSEFLAQKFKLPAELQTVILALTLSYKTPGETTTGYALPRIARHLTSIGVFGPGFGAVVPKWGGAAEVAQVACRAGAVGGGVYVLGTSVKSVKRLDADDDPVAEVLLSNGENIRAKLFVGAAGRGDEVVEEHTGGIKTLEVSKMICIIASPLTFLFSSTTEGAPVAAVSVVVLPPGSITVEGIPSTHPIYIMVHSSDTGECPQNQCQYPVPFPLRLFPAPRLS